MVEEAERPMEEVVDSDVRDQDSDHSQLPDEPEVSTDSDYIS
jgi:hypothetical protein